MKLPANVRATASAAFGVVNTVGLGWSAGWLFDQVPHTTGSAERAVVCILLAFVSTLTMLSFLATFLSPILIMTLARLEARP